MYDCFGLCCDGVEFGKLNAGFGRALTSKSQLSSIISGLTARLSANLEAQYYSIKCEFMGRLPTGSGPRTNN